MRDFRAGGVVASELELRRAFELLCVEHLYEGSGSTDSSWRLTLSPRLRKYRAVRNYVDFLRVVEAEAVSEPATSAIVGVGPATVIQPPERVQVVGAHEAEEGTPVIAVDSLHPLVRDACARRFALGHYREGVLKAVHALRRLVGEKSGLTEPDDASLMGKAFGGDDPCVRVADLATETGRNIQRGTTHLTQGIVARIRNPLTHEDDELDPTEALEMAALISRVAGMLSQHGPRQRTRLGEVTAPSRHSSPAAGVRSCGSSSCA
jgi:uncharacterized protein (TIGR02391 family)